MCKGELQRCGACALGREPAFAAIGEYEALCASLIERGDALLANGQFICARKHYVRALDTLEHVYDRVSSDDMVNVASRLHITLCRRVAQSLRDQGHPRIAALYDRKAFDRVLMTVRSGDHMLCARLSLLAALDATMNDCVTSMEGLGAPRAEIDAIIDSAYEAAVQVSSRRPMPPRHGPSQAAMHRFGASRMAESYAL